MIKKIKAKLLHLFKNKSGEIAGWGVIVGVVVGLAIAVLVIQALTGGVNTLLPQVISKLSSFIGS